jgi:uncharacterized protein (DUF1684 family)
MHTPRHFRNREHSLAVFSCLAAAFLLVLSSCGSPEEKAGDQPAIDSTDVYTMEVMKDRLEKDKYLLSSPATPIKASDMELFSGLAYFPVNKDLVFYTALEPLAEPEEVTIATSKDRPRQMLHIGALPFTITQGSPDPQTFRLQVYAPKDTTDGNYWFIPFADLTNMDETYAGGRYIDIEEIYADSVFLDFNYAYSPYCAYNERYDCPIPPPDNAMPIRIEAGEKLYPLHRGK